MNKEYAKAAFKAAGVPVSAFQTFYSVDTPLDEDLEFPLFVKPVREGSASRVAVCGPPNFVKERVPSLLIERTIKPKVST